MGVKVKERNPGEWWIYICHNNKRRAKKVGDEKTALKLQKIIEAKLALNEFNFDTENKKIPTFKPYAETWLKNYVAPSCRASTFTRYSGILSKFVYPTLGQKPLDQITRNMIRDLLLKLSQSASPSTVALVKDVISGPLAHAVDDELIASNPVTGILRRMRLERKRKLEIEPFTPDEVQLFLDTCQYYAPEHYPFFLTAFRTGLRLGELLALEWGDIDWSGHFITVRRSYKTGTVSPTKTGKTRRVDMSDQLTATLKTLLTQRKREALKEGRDEPLPIVFHRKGSYTEQNYIRRIYKRMLNKAGLREMRIHDIRHTFASLLLTNGESIAYVKEQMGHSSIQMTVDIYGHLIPGANRDAVNRLDSPQQKRNYPQPETERACNPM